MENTIAVVDDPLFLEHRTPAGHPERPERLTAARKAVTEAALSSQLTEHAARDATDDELARVHAAAYIDALARLDGKQGYLDGDTFCSPASIRAARRAAGAAITVVETLAEGRARNAIALVRPPGHHARPGSAMGFCLINNVAVAAAHARAQGAQRVAIVDWDVHHGNGTEEIFYDDPSVLYVSVHQSPFYPGTGAVGDAGVADGVGSTVNVPLSAGAGDDVYLAAFERIVEPVVAGFDPDLVLVSAGFDAHEDDPLASMRVSSGGFAAMTACLMRAIPRGADGRLGIVLEGGYGLDGIYGSLRATLETADRGQNAPLTRPSSRPLSPAHEAELARALAAAALHHRIV